MTNETEISIDSLTCPICLEKIATYVLSECSHSLCYNCIEGLHNHSRNIKCPTCRKVVTKSPILFQSLAYTMPENTHIRMKSLFQNWFAEVPTQPAQNTTNNFYIILQESAKKEYECYQYRNEIIQKWQYILNQINFQNSRDIQFDTISSISRVTILHHDRYNCNISGTSWSFIPFTQPVIIKDRFHLIEKPENNTIAIRHRRLIAVLTNNQVNLIRLLANVVINQMRNSTTNQFYDEINRREGYENTICIHSGLFGEIRNQQIVIGCRGVWLNGSNYGIRFHILNADNDLYQGH